MIKVVYDRTIPSVTMEGHAGSGEPGNDLVCASASILAYTLATTVKDMGEGVRHSITVDLDEERGALIACEPVENYTHSIRLMFDVICTGFDLLAQEYPDNVSFEVVDEDKKGE